MAVDLSVPRPAAVARAATIPARLLLFGIVAASFLVRYVAAVGHTTPLYFPDEYIYSGIARSLAQSGKPLIRGSSAHFPAMLEPLLAAPLWLTNNPDVAFRLTQAENALAMSLAAVPVYLLVRRLGGGAWAALAAAALTVASPDLFFSSFLLADPIAYPLVLGAVYVGVRALAEPSRRLQLGFAALAVLATLARVQYVFLPIVFVAAALVVERGSVRTVWSRFRLSLLLYAAPLAVAAVLGPKRVLGYYSDVADVHVRPGEIAHWLGTDAMLLAYAAGFALVPGAIVGIVFALWKPTSREECGFAALAVGLLLCLFAETAIYATNGSDRFQERYLMVLLPLVFPAFVLWLLRGRPAKQAVVLGAVGLLALSARVPLSGYTVSDFKQDSPFLMGVFRLEKAVGIGDGLARDRALRGRAGVPRSGRGLPRATRLGRGRRDDRRLLRGLDRCGLLRSSCRAQRSRDLPAGRCALGRPRKGRRRDADPDPGHSTCARARAALLELVADAPRLPRPGLADRRLRPPARHHRRRRPPAARRQDDARPARDLELRRARPTDRRSAGRERPSTTNSWRPTGTPRMALFVGGLYHDGWLSPAGHLTVYPEAAGASRNAALPALAAEGDQAHDPAPPGAGRRPARHRRSGQEHRRLGAGLHRGPWTLSWHSDRIGYLQPDDRPISVQAGMPTFGGSNRGSAAPSSAA